MPGDVDSLTNPAYWLSGLVIFCVGVWVGRAVALRLVPPSSWRAVAGMALIFAGVLAIPSRTAQVPGSPTSTPQISAPSRSRVVVAKISLAVETALSADNVELRDVASDTVQPTAATSFNEVQGKILIIPVAAGQQILTPYLDNPSARLQRAPAVMIPGRVAGQIIATEISPSTVKVGDTIDIRVTVKNTFDKPLQTQGPQPTFTYVQGQTYFTQQFASEPGKWRVCIGSAGLDSTELPYRWGFIGDLAPGASTTVSGSIKVTQDFKPTNFWAALVNEPSMVIENSVGTTLISSLPENLAIVAVDVPRPDPLFDPGPAYSARARQSGISPDPFRWGLNRN